MERTFHVILRENRGIVLKIIAFQENLPLFFVLFSSLFVKKISSFYNRRALFSKQMKVQVENP
jgi:hypothetical protein